MKSNLMAILVVLGLAGCASPPPPPPEQQMMDPVLVQQDASARAAFAEGNYERAARFYELALARARAADLGPEIAKAAYNQGACLLLLKRAEPARNALREASAELARQRRDGSSAWLLEARAARLLGDRAGAVELADRVLTLGRDREVRLQAWLLKGSLAAEQGDLPVARQALKEARRLLEDDPALRAGVAGLAGQLALADQRPEQAGMEFDKEAAFYQRASRWADMADALRRSGQAYAVAGRPADAALRFFRSARSLYAQGQLVPALYAMEKAAEFAAAAGDAALTADTGRLLEEIRQAVGVARAAGPVE